MTRFKLTSPGMLLILAVMAAGGIFLLDLFYLSPNVDSHKWSALREQASRAERAARISLQAGEENLLLKCTIWSGKSDVEFLRTGSQDADDTAGRVMAASRADMVWLTDANDRPIRGWSRSAHDTSGQWTVATLEKVRDVLQRRDDVEASESAGVLDLPTGPVIAARVNLPNGSSGTPARLWLARMLGNSAMRKIGFATSADLVLVSDEPLPAGMKTEGSASHALWLTDEDHLAVAWPARGPNAKALGYFRAVISVVNIRRQATASRRMVLIVMSLSVGLALLVIIGTHMLITGPVFRLLKRLQELESGEGTPEELANDLHGEPLMLARRLESAFERLAKISKTDELTLLANRRHFEEVLHCFYIQARRYNRPLSLMVMDVDYFKAVNDVGGHQVGDELLKKVAGAIEEACRKADLPARFGGDEFAVLLPETSSTDAEGVGQRIRESVAAIEMTGNLVELHATVSIGLADLNADEIDSPKSMIRVADRALYRAKELGRNQIVKAHDVHGGPGRSESTRVDNLCKKLAGLDSQFKALFLKAIQQIISILEHRDPYMADHARKVQHYSILVAREMGLPNRVVKRIQVAAMLHDIGMLAMPDAVILHAGPLDEGQLRMMRRHPLLSVRIMEGMEFLEQEIPAVRYHHEWWDGKGYPEGIRGAAIPLTARILSVADCFDALTTERSFRRAMSLHEAIAEVQRNAGSQFDPSVVEAFIAVYNTMGEDLLNVPGKKGSAWLGDLNAESQELLNAASGQ